MVSFHIPNTSISSTTSNESITTSEGQYSDARPSLQNQSLMADTHMPDDQQQQHHEIEEQQEQQREQPPAGAADVNRIALTSFQHSLTQGLISPEQFITLVTALSGPVIQQPQQAPQPQHVPEFTFPANASFVDPDARLARARATIQSSVPFFRGDKGDGMLTAGQWLECFEQEAEGAGLPRENWPLAMIRRFPAGSTAALWVKSIFGAGTAFTADWASLRSSFLSRYTPVNAVNTALAAYDQLTMDGYGNDVAAFNAEFLLRMTTLECVRRDAGLAALIGPDKLRSYFVKLRGEAKIYAGSIIQNREINNQERLLDNRATIPLTVDKLIDMVSAWHLDSTTANFTNKSALTVPDSSAEGTVPMDIDNMTAAMKKAVRDEVKEELNAFRQNFRRDNGGQRRTSRECFECGKKGHIRRDCYTYIRKQKENREKDEREQAGKASTQ